MKLTEIEIQKLYKFTREHFVEHYDVQTELVDHLANDIEQIWVENPKLSFEKARDISFKKFGVFGFMDVVEKRQVALSKKYWKIILHFAKEWFQLPKIIATFGVFTSLFQLFRSDASEYFFIGILVSYCVLAFVKLFQLKRIFNKRKKLTEKTWMLESMIFGQGTVNAGFIPFYTVQIFIETSTLTNVSISWGLVLAAFYTAIFIIDYVSLFVIPKKTEALLIENYPEYKLV